MVALAVFAAGAACGGGTDDARGSGAQPAPDVTTFEQGVFDEIPRYPRSEPLGPRSEKDGVVAQSFEARDASPAQVLDFFQQRLESWDLISQPAPIGEGTYRGQWARAKWILTISSTPAPTLEPDSEPAQGTLLSQYSLSLSPREAG